MRTPTLVMRVLVVLATCFTSGVLAMLPENGWYWNPNESGRGFNVEIQNNVLFMSGFVYDASGKPIWVVGSGTMTSDRNCSVDLYLTSGGQCFGCAYGGFPATAKYGTAVITFTSETTATVNINGTALSLQRQAWAIDLTNVATPLLGEWALVDGSSLLPVYFGERITFPSTQVLNGTLAATGSRTADPVRIAVGNHTPAGWGILLDSSPSYYTLYSFSFTGFNSIEGSSSTYLKGTAPNGSLPLIGYRIRSAAAAAGGNAPGVVRRALVSVDGATTDSANQARSAMAISTEGLAAIQEMALVLEAKLKASAPVQ